MNDSGTDPHRVLARNAACHQCRRRKLKCDAIRPTCGNCRKPRQRGPEKYEQPEPCTWDQHRDPSARTLRKREAKQRGIGQHGASWSMDQGLGQPPQRQAFMQPPAQMGVPQVGTQMAAGPSMQQRPQQHMAEEVQEVYSNPNGPWPDGMDDVLYQGSALHHGNNAGVTGEFSAMGGPGGRQPQPPMPGSMRQHPPQEAPAQGIAGIAGGAGVASNDLLVDESGSLVWTEWPKDLPSADIVQHIFQVFFDRVCVIPKMMHRATTMAALTLPPNAKAFPSLALIHSILAVTTSYLAPDALASQAYFPVGCSAADTIHPEYDFTPRSTLQPASMFSFSSYAAIGDGTPVQRFQMWHRRKSLEGMANLMTMGSNLIQLTQAMVCVTWVDMMNGWWPDMWVESGNAIRIAVPLYLHLTSTTNHDPLSHNVGNPMPPAATALEQAMRDRTWWMVYMTERCAGFGTNWVPAISHDEITVELPVAQDLFEDGVGQLRGLQNLESPDLLSTHPPAHRDSFPLLMKTIYLFSNTITFIRRYSRGQHSYARYLSDPGLHKCLSDINTFRMHCPPSMRRPVRIQDDNGETIDPDLYYCLNLTHAAVLNLGGPLITRQTWTDDGANMILHAARAILSLLYDIEATSYDLTLLPVVCSFTWYIAGRCLIRFAAAARATGDSVQASIFDAELQTLSAALIEMGQRHAVSLRYYKILCILHETAQAPTGEIIPLKGYSEEIFDSDYSSSAARPSNSAGSATVSPSAFLDPTSSTPTSTGNARLATAASAGITPPDGTSPNKLASGTMPTMAAPPHVRAVPPPPPGQVDMFAESPADWFKADNFDINSYSFDVEALAQLHVDPNATFEGSMMFPQHMPHSGMQM